MASIMGRLTKLLILKIGGNRSKNHEFDSRPMPLLFFITSDTKIFSKTLKLVSIIKTVI